jgi:hypothetical protein
MCQVGDDDDGSERRRSSFTGPPSPSAPPEEVDPPNTAIIGTIGIGTIVGVVVVVASPPSLPLT